MRAQLGLIAFSCAGPAAARLSGSSLSSLRDKVLPGCPSSPHHDARHAFVSPGGARIRMIRLLPSPSKGHAAAERRIVLSLASSLGDDDDDESESPGAPSPSSSSSSSSFEMEKNEQRGKRFASPPIINAYTEHQISRIFGSSPGESKFVPLSFAGRWSQTSKGGNTQQQQPAAIPPATRNVETILLSTSDQCRDIADAYHKFLKSSSIPTDEKSTTMNALPIPLSPSLSSAAIKLLSQTHASQPLSKSVLLSLNSLFLNRDNGLFDNLPWSTWSIDPNLSERDAANNVVEGKYTMGKRVAYQRFMGKDWQGRSLSLGNLANRIRFLLEGEFHDDDRSGKGDGTGGGNNWNMDAITTDEEDAMLSLSRRLLQLEMKEAQMEIAECEQRLAICKTESTKKASKTHNDDDDYDYGIVDKKRAEKQLEEARKRLDLAGFSLEELTAATHSDSEDGIRAALFTFPWDKNEQKNNDNTKEQQQKSNTRTLLISILDKLTEQETPPPYRGAIGYPAKLDTRGEVFEDSILPYSSPYDLLLEILDEQLNSEVMGCVLEPTSLLKGNLVLGGALLLKRKGVRKSTTLSGENISYTDDDDDLGNEGVLPRSMYVVECFPDEALGVAMASTVPIFVEEEIFNRAGSVPVKLHIDRAMAVRAEYGDEGEGVKDMESLSFVNRVTPLCPSDDSYFLFQLEGEQVSSEKESNSVRIPLTTNPQLFASDPVPSNESSGRRASSVFSTFNPVTSLDEYDELTDDGKARLLLKMESFVGILPRPRAVRTSTLSANPDYDDDGSKSPSLLDDILVPLIDESVRRQFLIRDAERRKDFEQADALRAEVSPRQVALEKAQQAREEGLDDDARLLEEDAELYKSLRADITQDEGAYNRFLDRDDWYERETQARIKRLDKSKFGTLLDGIDLP